MYILVSTYLPTFAQFNKVLGPKTYFNLDYGSRETAKLYAE